MNKEKVTNLHLDQADDEKTTTTITATLLLTTIRWQPGQLKNCTEPGECH
jgi:N-acetyl-beta-hexosaminidase